MSFLLKIPYTLLIVKTGHRNPAPRSNLYLAWGYFYSFSRDENYIFIFIVVKLPLQYIPVGNNGYKGKKC